MKVIDEYIVFGVSNYHLLDFQYKYLLHFYESANAIENGCPC